MGLFSSKSSSTSTTRYEDSSTNEQLTSGDMLASEKNIISGGDVYQSGVSEDMINNIFSGINENIKNILQSSEDTYKQAFGFVSSSIGKQSDNVAQVTSALGQAYNSEQSTLMSFKSYALYVLIGFIAWAYFTRKRS